MQILSSLRSPQLLKIFIGVVFLLQSSAILTNVPSTLWTKTCCKSKGQQDMKKVSFCERSLCIHFCISVLHDWSSVAKSLSNFKLFTLVQYLNDLFSAAVSSTTVHCTMLYFAHCTPNIHLERLTPTFLPWWAQAKLHATLPVLNVLIQSSNAWK